MITGFHAIVYSSAAEEVRAFFRDTLGLPFVDAGGGWLIFALPPAELAAHPTDGDARAELYLMCDDVDETVTELSARGATFSGPISDESWGRLIYVCLPGGGELGLYEPKHPSPLGLGFA
jgi:predicted enzyme related to lactoylglutathione lyase